MLDRTIYIVREQIESLLRAVEAPDNSTQNQYQIKQSIENTEIMLDKTLALEQQLLVKFQEYTQKATLMGENALNALKQGKDDLAKKAIAQQFEANQNAEEFEKMSEMAKKATNGIKKSLVKLDEKLVRAQYKIDNNPLFQGSNQSKTSYYNGMNELNKMQEKVSFNENELLIDDYKDSLDREFEAFFKSEHLKKVQEELEKEAQAQKQQEKGSLKSFFKKYF